jgi:hypothetical protein
MHMTMKMTVPYVISCSLTKSTDVSEDPAASIIRVENTGSKIVLNTSTLIPDYTASHPSRQ